MELAQIHSCELNRDTADVVRSPQEPFYPTGPASVIWLFVADRAVAHLQLLQQELHSLDELPLGQLCMLLLT